MSLKKIQAQSHGLGIFLEGSPFIKKLVLPGLTFGAFYQFKLNSIFFLKSAISVDKISIINHFPEISQRIYSRFIQVSSILEQIFFDIQKNKIGSPFLSLGVGIVFYEKNLLKISEKKLNKYFTLSYNIPFRLGYKFKLAKSWILQIDTGIKYTPIKIFENDISKGYQQKMNKNIKKETSNNLSFAKLGVKKWVTSSGISLAYIFGETSCYCQ